MNRARILWFPTLLLAALVFWGCDSTTTEETKDAVAAASSDVIRFDRLALRASLNAQARDLNQELKALLKAVAQALADEEVRMRFFKAAMEEFDGETNVLWMNLAVRTQQSVLTAAQAGAAPSLSSMQEIETTVHQASNLLGGKLHLYWAFAEDFNGSRAPLVTFTPMGVDSDHITDIAAFDAEGNVHVVNEQIAEQRPVVVLTANERTDAEGNVLPVYIEPNDILPPPCCGGGGGGGGGGDDDPPDVVTPDLPPRENGDTETMFFAKANYCPEGWPNADCEHYFTVIDEQNEDIDDPGYYSLYFTGEALDQTTNWVLIDRDMFIWETWDEGDHVVVSWYEADNQTGDGGPDFMGSQSINFDDPSDTVYGEDLGITYTNSWE